MSTNVCYEVVLKFFREAQDDYREVARENGLSEDAFLTACGMADEADLVKFLADALGYFSDEHIHSQLATNLAEQMVEEQATERKVRALLDLPPCHCGEGLSCPEITLNMLGHPNEDKVMELIGDPDAPEPEF